MEKNVEDKIRRIVREELKSLLESLAKNASDSDGYETGELESAALGAINGVMASEAYLLPHSWDCARRNRWSFGRGCSCGVESCPSCGKASHSEPCRLG